MRKRVDEFSLSLKLDMNISDRLKHTYNKQIARAMTSTKSSLCVFMFS